MKKALSLLLAVAMLLSLCACGGSGANTPASSEPTPSVAEEPTPTPEPTPDEDDLEAIEAATKYSDMGLCAEYAIQKLKDVLKSPSSLEVNELLGVEAEESFIFAIDYSAANSLGGMNRDIFYLDVGKSGDSYSVKTYGSGSYSGDDNQKYTSQDFTKYQQLGYYFFDTETYELLGMMEGTYSEDTVVELTGKMKGPNKSFGDAWNFEVTGDPYLKVVYFADGVDFDWYEKFTGYPYEITISAVVDLDGHYHDAVIIEDEVYNRTVEERFQTFSYYDREFFKENQEGFTALSGEEAKTALSDNTFKMRNNYGGDEDGTHTISFYSDGTIDAHYIYKGETYSMYESWKMDGDTVICIDSFTNTSGNYVTKEYVFTPYRYDDTHILLLSMEGDVSMILTKSA